MVFTDWRLPPPPLSSDAFRRMASRSINAAPACPVYLWTCQVMCGPVCEDAAEVALTTIGSYYYKVSVLSALSHSLGDKSLSTRAHTHQLSLSRSNWLKIVLRIAALCLVRSKVLFVVVLSESLNDISLVYIPN